MDNQYTPTYHKLWNRDFSLLVVAELLLCVACYMTVPFLPYRLYTNNHVNSQTASLTIIMFVLGIFFSGFFVCWLIQRYRRNKVFWVSALILSTLISGISLFDNPDETTLDKNYTAALMAVCSLAGMAFGNAKRVLSCTLLIDKTESCNRTEANYTAIWIARLTIIVGPTVAILLSPEVRQTLFYGIGATAALLSAILVMTIKFPFRAPEEGTKVISIDRFLLPQGWNVAIVVALMSAALGITMTTHPTAEFFASLISGLIIAILILRYTTIRNGRYTSAVGNACILVALFTMFLHNGILDDTLKPMIFGLGFGLTSSEQLYKMLGRCNHCQRSTAESTYFLASDCGLFLGIASSWNGNMKIAEHAAFGEQLAICLFAIATAVCCANAIIKKKHKEYHA